MLKHSHSLANHIDHLRAVNSLLQEVLLHEKDANLDLNVTLKHLEVNVVYFAK